MAAIQTPTVAISPGVFTREVDQSFLAPAIEEIGACIIGETEKGPAFTPTKVTSFSDFRLKFGNKRTDLEVPYAASEYLKNSNSCTIVRTLGQNGYTAGGSVGLFYTGSSQIAAIIHLKSSSYIANFVNGTSKNSNNFSIIVQQTDQAGDVIDTYESMSLDNTKANYVGKVIGTDPVKSTAAYCYTVYDYAYSASHGLDIRSLESGSSAATNFTDSYAAAQTTWIRSQPFGDVATPQTYNLFKFYTLSHGNHSNTEIKVSVSDIEASADENTVGKYGTFTVKVRGFSDKDNQTEVLETFSKLNLDPNSPDYITRRIGDRYSYYDSNGKLKYEGNYPNRSEYIRVEVAATEIPPQAIPFGFGGFPKMAATSNVWTGSRQSGSNSTGSIPSIPYTLRQEIDGETNTKKHWGFNFDDTEINRNKSIKERLKKHGNTSVTSNDPNFTLADISPEGDHWAYTMSYASTSLSNISSSAAKFTLGFYGGWDGLTLEETGSNKWTFTNATSNGTVDFRKAIDTVTNPDEIDINLLAIPGVSSTTVTTYAREKVRDRGDCFYVMDVGEKTDAIADVVADVAGIDDNYCAVYYPWLKLYDDDNDQYIWRSPTSAVLGAYAFNDRYAAEWYAPAGLNRGGLETVIEARERLTQDERDDLYEGKVNPIVTYVNTGIAIWGQKTLQAKDSALNRINVRRMLLKARKTIASSIKWLVFDGNNQALWSRFENLVNPILEDMRIRNGIEDFRVICDDTTNTPDLIDRNIMYGKIYIKPTRSAEIITLDFLITESGAEFVE